MLQPQDIAACFSSTQIQVRIDNIVAAIVIAEQSGTDEFNDMQASQKVRRQTLADLYMSLEVWVKAKNYQNGESVSAIDLVAANYTPDIPRI